MAFIFVANSSMAVEKKPIAEIEMNSLMLETNISLATPESRHIYSVWWIPLEFWEATMAQQVNASEEAKEAFIRPLSGISMLSIAQADLDSSGAAKFYSREEIGAGITVSFDDSQGKTHRLEPQNEMK